MMPDKLTREQINDIRNQFYCERITRPQFDSLCDMALASPVAPETLTNEPVRPDYDELESILYCGSGLRESNPERENRLLGSLLARAKWLESSLASQAAELADYRSGDWIRGADVKRLSREIDIAINGDAGAPQASLCDMVSQAVGLAAELAALKRENERLSTERSNLSDVLDEVRLILDESTDYLSRMNRLRAIEMAVTRISLPDNRYAELVEAMAPECWAEDYDHQAALARARELCALQQSTITAESLVVIRDEFKKADEQRLQECREAHDEARKWKDDDDMYGYSFHEGKASGMTLASLIFYRVRHKIESLLQKTQEVKP